MLQVETKNSAQVSIFIVLSTVRLIDTSDVKTIYIDTWDESCDSQSINSRSFLIKLSEEKSKETEVIILGKHGWPEIIAYESILKSI